MLSAGFLQDCFFELRIPRFASTFAPSLCVSPSDEAHMHHAEEDMLELNSLLSEKTVDFDFDNFSEVSSSTQICDFLAYILIAQKAEWHVKIRTDKIRPGTQDCLCFYLGFSNLIYLIFSCFFSQIIIFPFLIAISLFVFTWSFPFSHNLKY